MRKATRLLTGVALLVAGLLAPSGVAHATSTSSRLNAGQRWYFNTPGQLSPSGRFELFLDAPEGGFHVDELLHLASAPPGGTTQQTSWETTVPRLPFFSCQRHGYLAMQTDGNLVSYCSPGHPVWSSHTAGSGTNNHFQIQDNGNLVVYTASGRVVWASGSGRPMITTGEHVDPGGSVRTKESGHLWVRLTMQRGGDLVLSYGSRIAWHSGTHTPGSRLVLMPGGNLIVQGPYGHTLWSTHTAGVGAGTTLYVFDDGEIAEARLVAPHAGQLWSRMG